MAKSVDFSQDREFKAHVYQKLLELQDYLTEDARVEVVLTPQAKKKKKDAIRLTLVTTLDNYQLECDGQDPDIYTALTIAKDKMLGLLRDVRADVDDTRARDAQVQAVIEGWGTLQ